MYNFSKLLIMMVVITWGLVTSAQAKEHVTTITKPLDFYIDAAELQGDNLRLANGTDQVNVMIPVSTRAAVKSIKIHVKFINSISLSKDRSQLRFRFNGQVIGQVPLDPLYPEGSINLTIPQSIVQSGDNILQFESSLHTSQADASLYSSELWTEINVKKSTISVTSVPKAIEAKLSALPGLVKGVEVNGHYPITVLTVGQVPSDEIMNAASSVIQSIAQFTNDMPLQAYASRITDEHMKDSVKGLKLPVFNVGMDAVLLGTFDDLEKALGTTMMENQSDLRQWVQIYRNPKDLSKFVLVVAGRDDDEVLAMARYLAEINLNQIGSASVSLAVDAEELVGDISKKQTAVAPNMRYTFSQLGMKTKVLTGINDAAELQIKLPADLFAIADEDIDVMLHITYSAFLGDGSSISVLLNGEFQHSIPLNNPNGMHVNSWKLSFPLRSFKRGMNTIRFQGHIAPSIATKEHQHMIDSIKVTLFEDSIVRVPSIGHYSKLPNLALLKDTGYPYIESEQSIFYVKKGGDEHLSSALTLVAKLAQQQGHMADTISLSNNWITHKNDNLFIFTELIASPVRILGAAPLTMIDGEAWLPMSDAFDFSGIPKNILTPVLASDLVVESFLRLADKPVLQHLDLTSYGVMTQFESPYTEGKTVTLVTSKTPALLQAAVASLVTPQVWQQMNKDTFIWDIKEGHETSSFKVSDEYHTGDLSFFGKIAYHAVTSPIYLLLIIISLVVLLTWLTRQLLLRHSLFHSHH